MTSRSAFLQKLALIAGALLAGLLLLELGLRGTGFLLLSIRDLADRLRSGGTGEIRILCVGESTTYCYGGRHNSWPYQLERMLNERGAPRRFTVINKGIPGTNSSRIADKLPSWLYTYRPDAVVAMMGINDGEKILVTPLPEDGDSLARFARNLRLYKLFTLIREGARRTGGGPDGFLEADELAASLRKKLVKNPRDPAEYLKLGDALLERGLFQQAVRAFEKAQGISPSAEACFDRGMALAKAANWKKAREAFQDCLSLDPKQARAWSGIGMSYLMQHGKERGRAEEAFARALDIDPRNDEGLAGMAYCVLKKEDYRGAIDLAERAVAANPGNEWAHGILWSCHRKLHNTPAAIQAAERALAANPRNYLALTQLAALYPKMGDTARAEERSRQARELANGAFNPATSRNYRRIREILAGRKVRLVAMQYPVRPVASLRAMLAPPGQEVYVSNEENFLEALKNNPPRTIFTDHFAGDFGHCTPEGNRLIAENLARAILYEVFPEKTVRKANQSML